MSYGLITYSDGGQTSLTPDDRTMRYFYSFTTTAENGSRAIPGWVAGNSGYLVVEGQRYIVTEASSVYESGGRVYWQNVEYLRITCFYYR